MGLILNHMRMIKIKKYILLQVKYKYPKHVLKHGDFLFFLPLFNYKNKIQCTKNLKL